MLVTCTSEFLLILSKLMNRPLTQLDIFFLFLISNISSISIFLWPFASFNLLDLSINGLFYLYTSPMPLYQGLWAQVLYVNEYQSMKYGKIKIWDLVRELSSLLQPHFGPLWVSKMDLLTWNQKYFLKLFQE